jgi:hypothetical protein
VVVVRLGNLCGVGLKVVNGFLHFAQAHLTVVGHDNVSDVGIDLREAYSYKTTLEGQSNIFNNLYPPTDIEGVFVFYNQFSKIDNNNVLIPPGGFMLVTSNVLPQNCILKHQNDTLLDDVVVKSFT